MDTETFKEKIERMKLKSELFLKNNIKAFIKDIYNNYHFCEIKFIGEDWVIIEHFKGKREGEKLRIFWPDIIEISEYKEDGK